MLRLDWLLDIEVAMLYRVIYEDSDTPQYDIYNVMDCVDNNILTHIMVNTLSNCYLYDFRYGFTCYYNYSVNKDSIRLILRELDSLILPPSSHIDHDSFFDKAYSKNRVIGFLMHLINCLRLRFKSGEVLLANLNNENIVVSRGSKVKQIGFLPEL